MKLVRYAWWPLVLVTSVAAWWAVAYWLEPRPLWATSVEDGIVFCTYDENLKLIAGYQRTEHQLDSMIVCRAQDGSTVAQLPCPDEIYPAIDGLPTFDTRIMILHDKVWRFFPKMLNDKEGELQLKMWKYGASQQEEIVARWPFALEPHTYERYPVSKTLSVVWSTPRTFLVLRVLPTHQISRALSQAFLPNMVPGMFPGPLSAHETTLHCEVWHWQEATRVFSKLNAYTLRYSDVPYAPYLWTRNSQSYAKMHHTKVSNGTTIELSEFDPIASTENSIHRFFASDNVDYFSVTTGDLYFTQRMEFLESIDTTGQKHRMMEAGPDTRIKQKHSINDWRPLLQREGGQPIQWPASLDESIVGQDRLLQDKVDPQRYLYFSQVNCGSPYWPEHHLALPLYHFAELRLENGALQLEKKSRSQKLLNLQYPVYCGQLFVMGQHHIEMPEWVNDLLKSNFRILQFWVECMKINQPYVAEVSVESGEVRWKIIGRTLQHQLPLLGKDYLLPQVQSNTPKGGYGYECYRLPMKFYSPLWSLASSAAVLLFAVYFSLRRRQRIPTTNGAA